MLCSCTEWGLLWYKISSLVFFIILDHATTLRQTRAGHVQFLIPMWRNIFHGSKNIWSLRYMSIQKQKELEHSNQKEKKSRNYRVLVKLTTTKNAGRTWPMQLQHYNLSVLVLSWSFISGRKGYSSAVPSSRAPRFASRGDTSSVA